MLVSDDGRILLADFGACATLEREARLPSLESAMAKSSAPTDESPTGACCPGSAAEQTQLQHACVLQQGFTFFFGTYATHWTALRCSDPALSLYCIRCPLAALSRTFREVLLSLRVTKSI